MRTTITFVYAAMALWLIISSAMPTPMDTD